MSGSPDQKSSNPSEVEEILMNISASSWSDDQSEVEEVRGGY
jgi:hypothetical protein